MKRHNNTMTLTERIEAGLRAGNLSWWEMNLPSGEVSFDDEKVKMLGYPPSRFTRYTDFMDLVHPEDFERAMNAMRDHLEGRTDRYEVEYRILAGDGTYRWFRDVGAITEREAETGNIRIIGIVADITPRKIAEEKLQTAVEERDRLMREMNHRVKNNLNLVASLINLKDMALGDAVDLSDLRHRIHSIAVIHEKLYKTDDVGTIQLADYSEDLLTRIFSLNPDLAVTLDNRIGERTIDSRRAASLGLILNELATNAMKHAFRREGDNRFTLGAEVEDGDVLVVTVRNSGTPFPEDQDLQSPASLGLQLVTALVDQLDGTITLKRIPETIFEIRIPPAEE